MSAIITLTTDFGLGDAYVAAMKGVILSINPRANLVDICHTIEPQNIRGGAFVLSTVYEYFPQGTIHLAVVDPGVGTGRKAVIVKTPLASFVAPDNGVLSYVIPPESIELRSGDTGQVKPGTGLEVIALTRPQFWRSPVSATFHGRDVFAPVAAQLSLGLPPTDFGEKIDSMILLPYPHPRRDKNMELTGCILHVDRFGNLITNIKGVDLPQGNQSINIKIGSHFINGLVSTYAESEGLLALIGSSNYLEIALKDGSASEFIGARIGDEVKVRI